MKQILYTLAIALAAIGAYSDLSVFAAASLGDVMREIETAYSRQGGERIHFNFAGSGTLARQIEHGAPADVFISANSAWMDWLEERGLLFQSNRFNLAANELVMIAPLDSTLEFNGHIDGKMAVGDFKSVPAGAYAKEALERLEWLERLRPNLVMTSNVRMALLYVERNEVAAGIVYATDAKASGKVKVVGTFPPESHGPIIYPAAACSKSEAARNFMEFLQSEEVRAILAKHGYLEVAHDVP